MEKCIADRRNACVCKRKFMRTKTQENLFEDMYCKLYFFKEEFYTILPRLFSKIRDDVKLSASQRVDDWTVTSLNSLDVYRRNKIVLITPLPP